MMGRVQRRGIARMIIIMIDEQVIIRDMVREGRRMSARGQS